MKPVGRWRFVVEVYQILLLLWFIVLAMWLGKQFGAHNRRMAERRNQKP